MGAPFQDPVWQRANLSERYTLWGSWYIKLSQFQAQKRWVPVHVRVNLHVAMADHCNKKRNKNTGRPAGYVKTGLPKIPMEKIKPETHGPMVFPHETWISRAAHPDYPTDIIPIFLVYHALPCKHTPKKYGEPMTAQHV